jgi:hypothetical protein
VNGSQRTTLGQIESNRGIAIIGHYIKTHMHAHAGATVQKANVITLFQPFFQGVAS